MLRLQRILGRVALLAFGASFGLAQTTTLTLDQALASAEGVNLTVLLGREAAAQAVEFANQTRVGILPNVSLSAAQRRTNSVSISSGVAQSGTVGNRFDGKFSGTYNLLNAQLISATRAARAGVEVAQADYRATVQSVLATVAQSYFTHLRNLRRLTVLDANIARARTLLELAQNQFSAGVVTRIDVTRAQSQLELAMQARLQQETIDFQSELSLKRLLDLDPVRPVQLADFTVQRVDPTKLGVGAEQSTFELRADWIRAQKTVEQARLDVRTARFERLPALGVSGEYGQAAANFDDDTKKTAWFFGATVSVPVFDGLRAGADKRAALSRQRGQELRLHTLELQISSELLLARQDATSRNAQITVAENNLNLAREQLTLAQERYRQGVADNREVVEAQTSLAVADDNYVEAVYQYNLSRVELARAKGDVRTVLREKAP
jgi:outer membrane protein TolC